jgi:uncharacterized membrane protein
MPNIAASKATPEPARNELPSAVLPALAVAVAPLDAALMVALPDAPDPFPDVLDAAGVASAALDASVLVAVYIGGGKLVVAGPLTLATSI